MEKSTDLPHNLVAFVNDPITEQVVLDLVKERNMAFVQVQQGTVSDALNFVNNNRTPKLLILDISDSELPLGDVKKIQEHSAPNLNIIAIGTRNEVGVFRDLMSIGVSDYLVKPLNHTILSDAMDKANGSARALERSGKLIQFISSVGGAGATTVSSNIAWLLANRYFKRTLLMDTDFLFGTTNMMLDIKAENAYLDILESPDKIDDYFVETILRKYGQRLYYLGGLVDLVRGMVVEESAFDALVGIIKQQFNYVILDSQRTMNQVDRVCFRHADRFVIMAEMSLASAQNTARLMEFLQTDQNGKPITIIANKIGLSSSGALARESFEKIINHDVNYLLPLNESIVLGSANMGQPLVMSGGSLTDVLDEIAKDILGKNENKKIMDAIKKGKVATVDQVKNVVFDFINDLSRKL